MTASNMSAQAQPIAKANGKAHTHTNSDADDTAGTSPTHYSLQAPQGIPRIPDEPVGCNTLMGCFSHLTICTDSGRRFPPGPGPAPSTPLGSREEQRRIYLGPALSTRATGGPDAGPLIERFSCLFKDRECVVGGWAGLGV